MQLKTFTWYKIRKFEQSVWPNPFYSTVSDEHWHGCKHGCRRRSVPTRSGASQFALWASADDRHDTLSCFDWFSTNLRRPACGTNPWHPQHFSTEQAFRIRERLIERKDNNWGSTPFKSDAIYARTTSVKPWCHANSRRYTSWRKQGLPSVRVMIICQTT